MERLASAIRDPRLRVRAAYVVVLVLGALFSILILAYSQDVLNVSQRLVRGDLPLLGQIGALKSEIGRLETAVYDYHATGDVARFERDRAASVHAAAGLLGEIERAYGPNEPLPSLQASLAELDSAAGRLRDTLPVLPDTRRPNPLLERVSALARETYAELDALAGLIEARAVVSADVTQDAVRRMAQLAILFSMAVFLIAVFVGYYINLYLRESVERRRLSVFAERNPNPVMRLSFAGEIIYANAAAHDMARRMGAESARVLLPADLTERLRRLRGGAERYEVWQYQREARSFECGVHFLPDLRIFHVYVADVTERRLNEERLVFQAYHHALTGLPNRRMFQEVVEQTLPAPERADTQAAVLMIGVDRLKFVIDTLGHATGDQLLQAIAARLRLTLEDSRGLARNLALYHFDGDLFAVLVPGASGSQVPLQIAERVSARSAQPLYVAGREFFISFSIGIALFPEDGADAATLIKNAGSAMQRVREQGGRGLRLYKPEMNAMAMHWLALENYLRHAIERDELRLYYQPQVDVRSGRVASLEALLRWEHPERGTLSPQEFVRLAEDSGMILAIGDWVLRAACAQIRAWRDRGVRVATVAVNISGQQFHRQNLPALIDAALTEAGLPADALEVEITESVAMQDLERTVNMLHELKQMGVRLAIDDFGTGFSSLAYLKRFPLDKLKIDQSFVRHLAEHGADAAIVRAIITLGHALRLRVSAEGVETREQLVRLQQYECDEAQGTLYSQPLPAQRVESFLQASSRFGT